MSLIDRMVQVYDRVYPVSDRLGIKSHKDFTYTNRVTGVVTTVVPRPRVSSPPVHKMYGWMEQGVEVNNTDKYVTDISRTYTGILEGTICTIDSKPHTILWIDRDKTVTFNILCRPERAR